MFGDVAEKVLVVVVVCLMLLALRKAFRPPTVFTVRIVDGNPQAIGGKVTPSFLSRVQEVAAENEITRGTVSGYAHGKFIRLIFSKEIPVSAQQQLRNWWASFGSNAPPVGRPRCGT
jgi:Protein of unknown function (DUF3634)